MMGCDWLMRTGDRKGFWVARVSLATRGFKVQDAGDAGSLATVQGNTRWRPIGIRKQVGLYRTRERSC